MSIEHQKANAMHEEKALDELDSQPRADISRIDTIQVDNYHGLGLKTILVYLSCGLLGIAQSITLVGAGAFARNIAAVIGGAENASWLASIIVIETAVLGPPLSQAADFWGRKWFLVIPALLGGVGSIIIARASTFDMAIGGSVVASVSFAAQPLVYAVPSEILPRRLRSEAQAGINVLFAGGAIFAALVGTKLTHDSAQGFRYFYYIAAGLNLAAAVITAFCYNPPLRREQEEFTLGQKLMKLDWVGYFLFGVGVVLFVIALSWSQNPYPWTDAHILATFILGMVFIIVCIVHQWKFKKDGLLNHQLFTRDRNFALCLFALTIEGASFFAVNSFYVFEMSVVYDTGANYLIPGVRLVFIFIVIAIAAAISSVYVSKAKKLRIPTVIAFVAYIIFFILMGTATLSSSKAIWGYSVFAGFGIGIILTTLVTGAQLSAPPHLISLTSGLLFSFRSTGGAVGLAIFTAIFNSQIGTALPRDVAQAVLPLGLPPSSLPAFIGALASGHPEALSKVPGVTPEIIGAGFKGLQHAYLLSFRYLWVTAGAMALLGLISSFFLLNPSKDMTMHVDAPLEESASETGKE